MTKAKKEAALAKLEEMYPEAKAELVFSNPYEMLVATILSAQCTDKQVNKVTPAVFARYPDANTMADAKEEDLYPMVKSCGFKSKAGMIQSIRFVIFARSCEVILFPPFLSLIASVQWEERRDS